MGKRLFALATDDDGEPTDTSESQLETEALCVPFLKPLHSNPPELQFKDIELFRENHIEFLRAGIAGLPSGFTSLDASKPWICYWILHSLFLLGAEPTPDEANSVIAQLKRCQHPDGGFGGGAGQISHLAPTYAAVNALAIIGTQAAYDAIDRKRLLEFLLSVKNQDGSFCMHHNGEVDVRGTYCALSAATLCNIVTPELAKNCAEFVKRCQTYEGGMGGTPGIEAHGGYTFCGFAALHLLGQESVIDRSLLLRWAARRQMRLEGGFQGRPNKLVDGCYSFWVGGLFPLLQPYDVDDYGTSGPWLYDEQSLQEYVLAISQLAKGGFRDKPGKPRDFYHTCYCLSGLSLSQHRVRRDDSRPSKWTNPRSGPDSNPVLAASTQHFLNPCHPVFNISIEKADRAIEHFGKMGSVEV